MVRFATGYPFDVAPMDDARPYPHHFLRLESIPVLVRGARGTWLPFAEWGPLAMVATLVQTTLVATLLLVLPVVWWGRRTERTAPWWALLGYFAALGFAYLAAEIAAIQQLGLLLGHPVYAMAGVLVTFLLCSGVGSAVSDRLQPSAGRGACVVLAVVLAVLALGLLGLVHRLEPVAGPVRIDRRARGPGSCGVPDGDALRAGGPPARVGGPGAGMGLGGEWLRLGCCCPAVGAGGTGAGLTGPARRGGGRLCRGRCGPLVGAGAAPGRLEPPPQRGDRRFLRPDR